MPKFCCGTSVGGLLSDGTDRILHIERPDKEGKAPFAGHARDAWPSYTAALKGEADEELSVTIDTYELALPTDGGTLFLPNPCYSPNPHPSGGHAWQVYWCTAKPGKIRLAADEALAYAFVTPREIVDMCRRTAAWATGAITTADWRTEPGMEPPWVLLYDRLGMAGLTGRERTAVEALTAMHPEARQKPARHNLAA